MYLFRTSGVTEKTKSVTGLLLACAVLLECSHFFVLEFFRHPVLASNILQFIFPAFAVAISLYERFSSQDAVERRCWSAVAAAFAIWAAAQAVYITFLNVSPIMIAGVRVDDELWVIFGLPLLLAVHTAHDELDTVQWLDRFQAIFFFVVLYLMIFLRSGEMALSYAYLIQNLALILCCLLRLATCATSRERHFFVRLTTFLLVYGALETVGEFLYRHGWKSGSLVDLIWTFPMAVFIVFVQRDRLFAGNSSEDSNSLVNAVSRIKGLNISALTFLTLGISALLATRKPLLGGACVAACFALFALRTTARERAWDEAHGKLKKTVLQDTLTGLGNRLQLRSSLEAQLLRAGRARCTALLFVDLDRFKAINDSLGHAAGDALLIQVANRLREAAPDQSLVCRIGGDEFVVLAPAEDSESAQSAGEALLTRLRPPYEVGGHLLRCTASIGVVFAEPGKDLDDLIRTADQAMYRAKQLGKDRVQLFDSAVLEKINSRWRLEADLRTCVEENAIEIVFQPILMVERGRIEGFEALARWNHPSLGQVPPLEFIPLAEDTGLILKLGAQVLEKACRQVAEWNKVWETSLTVSVNVSPRQFAESGFVAFVISTLEGSGLSPSLLRLEITESALLVHESPVHQVLSQLRDYGVHISLDDFGTGYSSLSFLLNLPVDEVKVDRSFVSHMSHDPRRRELVRTVIQLGQSLGKRVVAEGVETEQELAELECMGCECAQGWLISRPLPAHILEIEMAAISARNLRTTTRPPVMATIESDPVLQAVGWRSLLAEENRVLDPTP